MVPKHWSSLDCQPWFPADDAEAHQREALLGFMWQFGLCEITEENLAEWVFRFNFSVNAGIRSPRSGWNPNYPSVEVVLKRWVGLKATGGSLNRDEWIERFVESWETTP